MKINYKFIERNEDDSLNEHLDNKHDNDKMFCPSYRILDIYEQWLLKLKGERKWNLMRSLNPKILT